MNLISRIAGAARLLATGKLAQSTGFEGAQMQRRLMAWRAGGESINSLILQGGELQRARARQLVRTNPYASNAAASFTAHAVGCGIKPSSLVENGEFKDRIQRLWLAWTDEAEAIFSGSAFSMVALTDAINKMPYVPGRIGQLGLFREQGVSTTSVMIEEREGSLTLVETTSRGAPAVQHVANKRKARSLTVPHVALEDTKQAVDQQFTRWVMLHVQSNPLPICTRPRVLIKGKRT